MLIYLCYFLSLFTIIISVFIMFYKKRLLKLRLRIFTIATGISIFFLVLPFYLQTYEFKFGGIVLTILYAYRSSFGGKDGTEILKIVFDNIPNGFRLLYLTQTYILVFMAPIMGASFLLTFFHNLFDVLLFSLKRKQNLLLFTELNEKSFSVACTSGKGRIVFLSNLEANNKLTSLARNNHFLVLNNSITNVRLDKFENSEIFFIKENEEENMYDAINIVEKYKSNKRLEHIKLFVTSSLKEAELLTDSLLKGLKEENNDKFEIRLINEAEIAVRSLLQKETFISDKKDIKILVIGAGFLGLEFIKNAIWALQMKNRKIEIVAIDKEKEKIEDTFFGLFPELRQYNIKFVKSSFIGNSFISAIDEYAPYADYVIISMGNENLNINCSMFLKQYYLRKHNIDNKHIFIKVSSDNQRKLVDTLCSNNVKAYNFNTFGAMEEIFNYKTLKNSFIDNLAKGVHLAYYQALDKNEDEKKDALKSYYLVQYNIRSSISSAIHILYKLKYLLKSDYDINNLDYKKIDEAVNEALDFLAESEHERWNAFTRSEGYITASSSRVAEYIDMFNSLNHVNYLSKEHPCLIDFNDLDELSKEINKLYKGKKVYDFKESDYLIVKEMTKIIKYALDNSEQ